MTLRIEIANGDFCDFGTYRRKVPLLEWELMIEIEGDVEGEIEN